MEKVTDKNPERRALSGLQREAQAKSRRDTATRGIENCKRRRMENLGKTKQLGVCVGKKGERVGGGGRGGALFGWCGCGVGGRVCG